MAKIVKFLKTREVSMCASPTVLSRVWDGGKCSDSWDGRRYGHASHRKQWAGTKLKPARDTGSTMKNSKKLLRGENETKEESAKSSKLRDMPEIQKWSCRRKQRCHNQTVPMVDTGLPSGPCPVNFFLSLETTKQKQIIEQHTLTVLPKRRYLTRLAHHILLQLHWLRASEY